MDNLDPRTKIVIIACISAAALITKNLWMLTGLLVFTVLLMMTMGISISRQKKQLMTVIGMVIFLFVLQAVFGRWELGLVLCVRLMVLLMSALILLTGEPRDYLLAMVQCRMPYELAYMVILAFRFFPLLREEAMDIYYSIQLRGTELQKISMGKKLDAYRRMCIPILAGAMERAGDTSIAMEIRGFRAKGRRTYMRHLKLKALDVAVIIVMVVLTGIFAAVCLGVSYA